MTALKTIAILGVFVAVISLLGIPYLYKIIACSAAGAVIAVLASITIFRNGHVHLDHSHD